MTAEAEDLSDNLARFATSRTAVPVGTRAIGTRLVIDTIASTLATKAIRPLHGSLVALLETWGGTPASSVIGYSRKCSPPHAALANGALARGANLDDCHDDGGTHPSAVVVPAVLALAEANGSSGAECLDAVAIGDEIVCRLGSAAASAGAVPMERWFVTSVFGLFGATAACCRILGLEQAATRHAFGIALAQASGTLEPFSPAGQHSALRGIVAGFASQSAVMAASLAAAGVTASPESLEGRFGLNAAFFDGRIDATLVRERLGERWLIEDIGQKAWPVVRYLNGYVDAMRLLLAETTFRVADIERIEAHVSGYVSKFFEPAETQCRPLNYDNAVHALPFLVALMATGGTITPRNIIAHLDDPVVLDLARRVVPRPDPAFGADNRPGPGKLTVLTRDGRRVERTVARSLGDPANPLSLETIRGKFLAAYDSATAEREGGAMAFARLSHLDREPSIAEVMGLLRG